MSTSNQVRDDVVTTDFPCEQISWGFDGRPIWTRIERDDCSQRWYSYGPLDSFAKRYLVSHFHLEAIAEHLSLEELAKIPPPELRELANRSSLRAV